MDFTIILTIILINTFITLLVFNINAEQQSKIFKEQNEFNAKTVELFKDLTKGQIELNLHLNELKLKYYKTELEEKIMKLDKRIIQAINYNVKEILINKKAYDNLTEETKKLLKLNNIKVTIDNEQKEFICRF